MRRAVIAAFALLASCVPGAWAEAPLPDVPLVPGRTSLAPVADGAEWLRATREAIAGTGEPAREVLALLDGEQRTATAAETDYDLRTAFVGDDYDRDGVADVVIYRTAYDDTAQGPEGFTELTVLSGRTGARRWHRHVDDMVFAQPILTKVGRGGRLGIVLLGARLVPKPWTLLDPLSLLFPRHERRVRAVGLTGTGGVAYDVRLTTEDGKGDIQFGGEADIFPGSGTELLFGRVGTFVPGVLHAQPVAVDGHDGSLHALREVATVPAQALAYLAVGDLDRDNRADFLEVRTTLGELGTVVAHSPFEDRTLWTADRVPVGWAMWTGGTANVTGDADRDVVLNMMTSRATFAIAGVSPDDLPLLSDHGVHGLLFDGHTGALRWDRLGERDADHQVWADLNRDGKAEVLTSTGFTGDRDGIRIAAVDGAGRELYRRDVTVTPAAGEDLRSVSSALFAGGDLDGDRVEDALFYVTSQGPALSKELDGLFLVRGNRPLVGAGYPFGGTLDGGTDERMRVTAGMLDATYTVSDGWRGGAYWTVSAKARLTGLTDWASWRLRPLPGARGRCDGAILYGSAPGRRSWFDVLDGRTGRVRWSRTVQGERPPTSVQASGRAAPCR